MNLSNELKVGLAVVAAGVIFFFGVRYFSDLPLLGGSYSLRTQFDDAGGLVAGNAVRLSGVKIGSVEAVRLDPETKAVDVRFRVDEGVTIPQGSEAEIAGLGAFGGVRLVVIPGPPGGPPVEPESTLPGRSAPDVIGRLSAEAPQLIGRADTVLAGAGAAISDADRLLSDPDSDLRQTLRALRNAARTLERTLGREEEQLGLILENAETATAGLSAFTAEGNLDSLGATVERLNRTLARAESSLDGLEAATERLAAITAKIDQGEGTLGRLVNDDGLYLQLDSAAASLNRLLLDVEENPDRYLRELRLIDLF